MNQSLINKEASINPIAKEIILRMVYSLGANTEAFENFFDDACRDAKERPGFLMKTTFDIVNKNFKKNRLGYMSGILVSYCVLCMNDEELKRALKDCFDVQVKDLKDHDNSEKEEIGENLLD